MMKVVFQYWIVWAVVAALAQGSRTLYLEYKIGELMGMDSLETRMLDAVRRERAKKQAWPTLLMTLPALALLIWAAYWLPVSERSVVYFFVGIALSGMELLKEFDQRRELKTAEALRPHLWRLSVISGVSFVLNVGAAYSFSVYGMS